MVIKVARINIYSSAKFDLRLICSDIGLFRPWAHEVYSNVFVFWVFNYIEPSRRTDFDTKYVKIRGYAFW